MDVIVGKLLKKKTAFISKYHMQFLDNWCKRNKMHLKRYVTKLYTLEAYNWGGNHKEIIRKSYVLDLKWFYTKFAAQV